MDAFEAAIKRILADLKVEITDEFDRNFQRQAFFTESWKRRRSPVRQSGSILISSGALRRSIRSRVEGGGIVFYSTLPYADIHNEGGTIKVTDKMKKFFWRKYYSSTEAFTRRKDGVQRRDKKNKQLTDEAEFWKAMALMKVGSEIKIPKRQFIGQSPALERAVTDIINRNLEEFFNETEIIKQ